MKFELTSDESVLALNGAAAGVYAAQFGLAPRQAQDTFFDSVRGAWRGGGGVLTAAACVGGGARHGAAATAFLESTCQRACPNSIPGSPAVLPPVPLPLPCSCDSCRANPFSTYLTATAACAWGPGRCEAVGGGG